MLNYFIVSENWESFAEVDKSKSHQVSFLTILRLANWQYLA